MNDGNTISAMFPCPKCGERKSRVLKTRRGFSRWHLRCITVYEHFHLKCRWCGAKHNAPTLWALQQDAIEKASRPVYPGPVVNGGSSDG